MVTEELAQLAHSNWETSAGDQGKARISMVVGDAGNRNLLEEWLDDHTDFTVVDGEPMPAIRKSDLCIVDETGFQTQHEELEEVKTSEDGVLLPVLLLVEEEHTGLIEIDNGDIADNVFKTTIDEIVSLPMRQTELEWRLQSLLRLRSQTMTTANQNAELTIFKRAIDASGHAVYITDVDGSIKYVNSAFEEITGFTPAEAVGQTPKLLDAGEMSQQYFDRLWDTVLSGDPWHEEITNQTKAGETYTAMQTIAPVTEKGDIQAFVAVQEDITERKARENRLKRRTDAIEEAPLGIVITDPEQEDNPMIYVNDGFVKETGYAREDALGENCRFLQGEDTDPDRIAKLATAIEAQEPISIELRNYREDGSEFWNHLEIAPIWDENGDLDNYIGFQQNVTDRRDRQEQLQVIDRVLRHNLRNDLNVVRGMAATIQSEASAEIAEKAEKITESSDQLTKLAEKERKITTILQEQPISESIDVNAVLEEAASRVQADYPAASIEIESLEGKPAQATPELEEAMVELISNAVIHDDSPEPEVTLETRVADGKVIVEITDEGPRIPDMERDLAADEIDPTPLYHGSGLGLWLVKKIVSRSQGSISIEDNNPCGNIVRLQFQPSSAK